MPHWIFKKSTNEKQVSNLEWPKGKLFFTSKCVQCLCKSTGFLKNKINDLYAFFSKKKYIDLYSKKLTLSRFFSK